MGTHGNHAVVMGAGIGGLLAARVLAEHYEFVTVLDRDPLPDGPRPRRGVPQGPHGHTLLPRGGALLDGFFPGVLADLGERGVPVVRDDPAEIHFEPLGHHLKGTAPGSEHPMHVPSRPLLEQQVREQLARVSNVRILDQCAVDGPRTASGRVTGVRVTASDGPFELDAELVVDALGRGSRTPAWLAELGYPRPEEDTVTVRGAYSSLQLRVDPGALVEKMVLISATPTRSSGAAMFRHEDDMWDVSVFGVGGQAPPSDAAGIIDFAAEFTPPHVVDALRAAEVLAGPNSRTFPTSRWRRYDRMRTFPEGLLVLGDGVCSLNPTYGQGMSVAAMQARALAAAMREGAHDLPRRYFRAAAKPIRDTWRLAAVADRAILGAATGPLPWPIRALAPFGDTFFGAVAEDPALQAQFLGVFTLFAPPTRLLTPSIGLSVARMSLRRRRGRTAASRRGHEPPESAQTAMGERPGAEGSARASVRR